MCVLKQICMKDSLHSPHLSLLHTDYNSSIKVKTEIGPKALNKGDTQTQSVRRTLPHTDFTHASSKSSLFSLDMWAE